MVDHSAMPLGKLAPKHDPRTLQMARYLQPEALPPSPASRFWDKLMANWGMMGNDKLGCCTCAACAHQVQVWTLNNGAEVTVPDPDIITAYSAVSGYDPKTGANDNGAVELDVLNYWRKTGVGGHKLGAFAAVDATNHDLVKATINLFGGIYIGVNLPVSAQTQTVWDVVKGPNGRAGSWGGHAVVVLDYDATSLTCVTWGALQRMTWAFWAAYVDEAYACLGTEWFNGQQQAPSGFDLAALTRDLALVSGQPDPGPPPWQPDPAVRAWLQWQQDATAYVQSQYLNGPSGLAPAAAEEAVIAQYEPGILALLRGQPHALPATIPGVPA